jgi:hypothetical protein
VTSPLSHDTDSRTEEVLVEGLRKMGGARRLARVFELREAALSLARARLRETEGELSPREIQLRLASRWLEPETMRRAFGWEAPAHTKRTP